MCGGGSVGSLAGDFKWFDNKTAVFHDDDNAMAASFFEEAIAATACFFCWAFDGRAPDASVLLFPSAGLPRGLAGS